MTNIRFATMNIGGGVPFNESDEYNNNSFNSVDNIVSIINNNSLDIACFQEVLMGDENHPSMSYEIAKKSNLRYFKELLLSDSHIVNGRKMGVSIISRFPFTDSEIFMLENPNITHITKSGAIYISHEKGFLITKVCADNGEVCCVTGHCLPFHSFDRDIMDYKYIYTRLEDKLISLLDKNRHIIIGADFNTTRLPQLMPELFNKYHSIVDIPTRPNGRGDDYILCDMEADVQFRLIKTCYDHYCCMALFCIS